MSKLDTFETNTILVLDRQVISTPAVPAEGIIGKVRHTAIIEKSYKTYRNPAGAMIAGGDSHPRKHRLVTAHAHFCHW